MASWSTNTISKWLHHSHHSLIELHHPSSCPILCHKHFEKIHDFTQKLSNIFRPSAEYLISEVLKFWPYWRSKNGDFFFGDTITLCYMPFEKIHKEPIHLKFEFFAHVWKINKKFEIFTPFANFSQQISQKVGKIRKRCRNFALFVNFSNMCDKFKLQMNRFKDDLTWKQPIFFRPLAQYLN